MAIGATCAWEARTTGANTNGGGYTSGGVDKSQQNAAEWALVGCTSAGAGNVVLNANAHADMIGNVGCCVSGTNFTASEFFEVLSVVAGVSITFGTSHASASICTGIGAIGVINIGGAHLIGGSLDDEWFDSHQPGNTIYIASTAGGVTYTLGEIVSAAVAGTALLPITFEAYKDTRGTIPTGIDRPTIACGTYTFSINSYRIWKNFIFTSAASVGISFGTYNRILRCKSINTYASANGPAFSISSGILDSCEAISPKGYGIYVTGTVCIIVNCYIHDCKSGIVMNNGYDNAALHCIIDTCINGIVPNTSSFALNCTIRNCVTGISDVASVVNVKSINNIISDCVTGASWAAEYPINHWAYNCFNNTTDNTNVTLDSTNLVQSDPLLGSGLVSGTDGATGVTGLVFTAVSNPFSGVTTSDCLLIKVGGTGATVGVYVISSVDSDGQLTLATSAGASKTGITYGIVKGADFTLGALSPCFNTGLKPSTLIGLD